MVFLRHMSDYPLMNEVYTELFGDHRPARSAIGVAELPLGALVEVEAWAWLGA
jgi:2-iminobutanoate/2-iminopropanoate deaminase